MELAKTGLNSDMMVSISSGLNSETFLYSVSCDKAPKICTCLKKFNRVPTQSKWKRTTKNLRYIYIFSLFNVYELKSYFEFYIES